MYFFKRYPATCKALDLCLLFSFLINPQNDKNFLFYELIDLSWSFFQLIDFVLPILLFTVYRERIKQRNNKLSSS